MAVPDPSSSTPTRHSLTMTTPTHPRFIQVRRKTLALIPCTVALCGVSHAQDAPVALTPVTVTAPTPTPPVEVNRVMLENTRPQSMLTRTAIDQVAPPAADFGTLANLLPSFVSSAPNGNGFDAAKNMTLRGFPDGQFNITLDGIPFADPDGFTHHSTSVFPASSIEQVSIDRSPGSGSTLGYSTIGGSLNIQSLEIPNAPENRVYGAYGSFATSQIGVRLNTAKPKEDGQTGLLLNVQHLQTNGAMSNADGRRDDILLKSETRFSDSQLTLLYSYDNYHFYNPASLSTSQLDQFGRDFGFSASPSDPSYFGYAKTDRSADFGYARLATHLGGDFSLVDTLYTYSYDNEGLSLKGDMTASPVGSGFGVPATDIGGRTSHNRYRTVGNILQFEHADAAGTLHAGLWLEHSHQTNHRDALDLTTGETVNENKNAGSPVIFDYDSNLDTVQPFVDYEWKATPALTIRPGLRYQRVRRGFDASVVPNSLPGTDGEVERSVNSLLPSLEGNYAFTPQTHAFVQWAKGALVPNQSFFYSKTPSQGNQADPETAQAFQAGVMHTVGPVNLSADVYWINLDDYVSTVTLNGNTQFVNNGKVRYRGIEVEGNADVGAGFTAVFNASVMRAQFRNAGVTSAAQQAGDSISFVPTYTGLLGVLYKNGAWSGSVLTKFVGAEYQGKNGSSDGENFRVSPYSYTSASVWRSLDEWVPTRHASVGLQIDNLFDRDAVTDKAGPSAAGPVLVNVLAKRGFTVAFRCDL
jgi:iron complex outermembrane receptor protein